jgi:ribulose-5-phosphate 4-epimerase/fuculose-1-phosphate aldolase
VSAASRPDGLLDELAVACRQLAEEGHEDENWAHLAVRDPGDRGFWLKRSGVGLSEIDGPGDFVLLDYDGQQLEGSGGRHLEWPIHAEIMRARPDVQATCHTHEFGIRLFSATNVDLQQLIPESTAFVDGLPRFTATSALIRTPELGRHLTESLGNARAVVMANHGAAVAGTTVPELAVMVIALTRAIAAQRELAVTGWPPIEATPEDAAEKAALVYHPGMMDAHWSYYRRRDARQRGRD